MKVRPVKTGIFRENEDLPAFIVRYVKKLPEKSILVVTSKIVALSEGRTLKDWNERMKEAAIREEADFAVKTKLVWMTMKDGHILASAGIDESNGEGRLIFLPRDSFQTARNIRRILMKTFKVKKLGVLISDSKLSPLRRGVVGAALGYAGFAGLRDYRGKKDIFGRTLRFSSTNVADSLATAAVLTMGEGDEQQPLALITGAPVRFRERVRRSELSIRPAEDMFYPIFKSFNAVRKKKK